MKKRLFIILSAIIVALAVLFSANYLLSLHKASFSLNEAVTSITIYDEGEKEVGNLSTSGSVSLQEGKYYVIPEGDNLSKDKIEFTVKKEDVSVNINPDYTTEYLASLLSQEDLAIQAAVTAKYPTLIDGYILSDGKLYKRGEWFGGLLKPKVADMRDQKSPYRVVLHKKDGEWEVIRRPEYVLSSSRYKEVPIDVLRDINATVGELDS